MFDGYRGTVVAGPMEYGVGSRELSAAIHCTPVWRRASGIDGLCSPECSPVTSSRGSIGRPFDRPHCALPLISAYSVDSGRLSRLGCEKVWLIHPKLERLASSAWVSGSVPVGLSATAWS